jgi:rhodanese-related sulfurtransferase
MQGIKRQQLEQMNGAGERDFVLVNVLPREAFNEAHIRTSINIPQDEPGFEETVAKVAGSKNRDVVVYCASFDCDASLKAAEKLDKAGFAHIFDYEGGTRDWLDNHENA